MIKIENLHIAEIPEKLAAGGWQLAVGSSFSLSTTPSPFILPSSPF